MKPALWTVEFATELDSGGGVAVFMPDRIVGGDANYYYNGRIVIENGILTGEIEVRQFGAKLTSVFGPLQAFNLNISGNYKEPIMILNGYLVNNPDAKITITCTKRVDL